MGSISERGRLTPQLRISWQILIQSGRPLTESFASHGHPPLVLPLAHPFMSDMFPTPLWLGI